MKTDSFIRKCFAFLIAIVCIQNGVNAQEYGVEIIKDQPDFWNKEYIARDRVSLQPGYFYHATSSESMSAHIDETLLLPVNYLTEEIDVDTRELDYNLAVGSLPGSIAVTPTGAAVYSIPIEVPPGTNGMQPNLSVNYNSQGGDGIFGIKWQLSGLSSISRTPRDMYHDGEVSNVDFTYDDRFSFDGNRLVIVGSDSYGADQSVYHTEMESFSEITSHGTAGNGPSYFTQLMANGTIVEYGNTADSKIEAQGRSEVLFWLINKITDVWENSMEFFYVENNSIGEFYIDRIEYTKNESAGLNNHYNEIRFIYENRTDKSAGYLSETLHLNKKVIAKIQTYCEGQKVLDYNFKYIWDDYNTKLSFIQLTNKIGEKLNPTVFQWGEGEHESTANIAISNIGNEDKVLIGDFNNDGIADVFSLENVNGEFTSYWTIRSFNSSSNTYETINSQSNIPLNCVQLNTCDLNGDGILEILVLNQISNDDMQIGFLYRVGTVYFYQQCTTANMVFDDDFDKTRVITGDFNSDGKDELLILYDSGYDEWSSVIFAINNFSPYSETKLCENLLVEEADVNSYYLGDFNGDRVIDMLYLREDDCQIFQLSKDQSGNYQFQPIQTRSYPGGDILCYTGDFNGDGTTDVLTYSSTGYYGNMFLNNNVDFIQSDYLPYSPLPGLDLSNSVYGNDTIAMVDVNYDGRQDIVLWKKDVEISNKGWVWIVSFNGTSWETTVTPIFNTKITSKIGSRLAEINGDGILDLLSIQPGGFATQVKINVSDRSRQIVKISNGLNFQNEIEYKFITDPNVYVPGNSSIYPILDIIASLNVVSNLWGSNSVGGMNENQFKYKSAKYHLLGKGFLGFENVITTNMLNAIIQTDEYELEPITVSPYLKRSYQYSIIDDRIINETVNTLYNNSVFTFNSVFNTNSYLVLIGNTVATNNITNTSTICSKTYNSFASLTEASKILSYNGSNQWLERINYSSFSGQGSFYPNKPQIVITETRNLLLTDNYLSESHFNYNTNGVLNTKVDNYNFPDKSLTSIFFYDDFGNLEQTSVAGFLNATVETLTTYIEYEAKGRFPIKNINPLGHEFTAEFKASTGQVLSATNPNNLTSSNEYDGFGNLIKIIDPIGNSINIEKHWYEDSDIQNAIAYTETSSDVLGTSYEYFNITGQKLKSITPDFNINIAKDFEYNEKGQLVRSSYPYNANAATANEFYEKFYDIYGRDSIIISPVKTISFLYDELETTTNDLTLGQTKHSLADAAGNIIEVEDISGNKILYEYNCQGLIESIEVKDGSDNLLSSNLIEYDEVGNQESLTDPNAGTTSYSYNAFGMLLTQTDGNSNQFSFTYDKLGRVIHSSDGGAEIYTYTYDNSDYGIGMLSSIAGTNGYLQTDQYDQFSRLISSTDRIDGVNYTNSYVYNNVGQLVQEIYPSNFSIKNHYDNHGILYKITKENGDPLWEMTTINEMGQITDYRLGDNGINCTNSYDSYHLLQAKTAKNINQYYLQNLSYSFDHTCGNLLSRSDVKNNQSESFTYDPLINKQLASSQIGNNTISVEYDVNGNILKKSDACGVDGYEYDLVKVHAVTRVNDPIAPLEAQSVSYNSYNQPSSIVQGLNQLELFYGPDGQRRKTVLSHDQIQQKTKYFLGNYEKVIDHITNETKEYYYLSSPSGLMAVATKTNGASLTYKYILTDHLGSIQTIVNEAGIVENEYSYDPWGRSRNANDWRINSTSIPAFSRGFTGHEHLLEFGLINMNGRLYDPLIGRMLSPDDFVQNPENSLGFNRYSYALNNPLKYTDPDGEWFVIDDLIAAGIGGLINLGVNAFNGNLSGMGFWETLGKGAAAFGAGAASGTLALYGPAGWAAGGAIVGGTNAWLGGATSFGDIAMGAGVGAFSGLAGGAVGTWAASSVSPMLSSISSPVLRGAITGAVGGAAGGYAGGFTGGLLMTGDFSAAHQSGMSGMWMGAGIGGAAGAGYGYKYSVENNINPWTGKPIESPYQPPQVKGQEGVNRAIEEVNAQGGKVLSQQVTLEVNGVRVRVDIAADFNGQITLIEVKNGPSANFTPNQKIVYPQMTDVPKVPVIPRGANASPVWGPNQIGQPTTVYILKIIKY